MTTPNAPAAAPHHPRPRARPHPPRRRPRPPPQTSAEHRRRATSGPRPRPSRRSPPPRVRRAGSPPRRARRRWPRAPRSRARRSRSSRDAARAAPRQAQARGRHGGRHRHQRAPRARELAAYKRKVKVNGEEREVTIAEALERYPLAEGAHQRFREASEKEKQAAATIERLKSELAPLKDPDEGPRAARAHPGRRRALRRDGAPRRRAPQARDDAARGAPACRGARAPRARLRDARAEAQARARRVRGAAPAGGEGACGSARAQHLEQLKRTAPVVLEQVGLPVTPETIGRYAAIKAEALRHGIPYTDAQVAERVRAEFSEAISAMAKSLPPEAARAARRQRGEAPAGRGQARDVAARPRAADARHEAGEDPRGHSHAGPAPEVPARAGHGRRARGAGWAVNWVGRWSPRGCCSVTAAQGYGHAPDCAWRGPTSPRSCPSTWARTGTRGASNADAAVLHLHVRSR